MTTMLLASTGGHLAELHELRPRLGIGDDYCWVTFDTPQSRSLLAGEPVIHVPPATSRDVVGTLRDYVAARRLLAGGRFTRVISTGASVAVSFFVPAVRAGVECHYIESATRTHAPSLSGRLVARLPGVHLHTQYAAWAGQRWRFGGSVFDGHIARQRPAPRPVGKVVVALGTHEKFRFPRLLSSLVRILPDSADVLWQVGSTEIPGMPAGARRHVPHAEMQQAMREADVVVTHAGVGSALAAMRTGKRAIYVPRRRRHSEHVDDHQVAVARELDTRGLVLAREADEITAGDLAAAASWEVRSRSAVTPFRLGAASGREERAAGLDRIAL
ncbi:glycosyltransferase [Spirilliplanes yamanashiensis]|uniref:Glycosyl transferase n=1 Tax=Spirilliplanes yamanashiensis TaxID=42233 RepID=A0A8J4DK80_9ACTN|nr:glycosyltransferase [Spirilliplanes yamanashiensis]MDP9818166.1 UDP-N-acetylglucosamine transferase subunit ALG13 [Spirilliplanes yamanashiensis]GIJ04977.1 glycosyl transferase [Spirilliplanes yamanashiensis]